MVAITVILAAVVGGYVFGMVGSFKGAKTVAVIVNQPEQTKITVMYQGGQDAQDFSYGNVTVTPGTGSKAGTLTFNNGTSVGGTQSYLSNVVGNSVTITTTGDFAGRDHVVVVGTFMDSSQQVLLDTYV